MCIRDRLRIPIIKFSERGIPNKAVWDMISLNVRTPEEVLGDLQAQIASCKSGEEGMCELFERYGVKQILSYGLQIQDYAEQITRAEISEFPNGEYSFTDQIDGLGEMSGTTIRKALKDASEANAAKTLMWPTFETKLGVVLEPTK